MSVTCNIFCIITDIRNSVYQIGTKYRLVEGWFPWADIKKSGANVIRLDDITKDNHLSLRKAAAKSSASCGQGSKKSNCKAPEINAKQIWALFLKSVYNGFSKKDIQHQELHKNRYLLHQKCHSRKDGFQLFVKLLFI